MNIDDQLLERLSKLSSLAHSHNLESFQEKDGLKNHVGAELGVTGVHVAVVELGRL